MSFKKWRDLEDFVDEESKPLLQEDNMCDIYPLPDDLVIDMQLMGLCDCCSHLTLKLCTCHKTADIRGVKFTAGEPLSGVQQKEWNNPHSGSVFTSKVQGNSMYGRFTNFIRVSCPVTHTVHELATVQWFAPPTYPDGDPLLVRIDSDSLPDPLLCPQFVFLRDVDPTPVMYELADSERCMYMMRLRGVDSIP